MGEASQQDRLTHSMCVQLIEARPFKWYVSRLEAKYESALHRAVSRQVDSRDYEAGRAAGLKDALEFVGREYARVKDIVEVVS